jgi:DNA-binding response OmpR family regulator
LVSFPRGLIYSLPIAKEHFDVVIRDLKMKDLSGAPDAEIMEMQEITTPVIAITGVSVDGILNVQDSFAKIFYKPVDLRELFKYVETLMRIRSLQSVPVQEVV